MSVSLPVPIKSPAARPLRVTALGTAASIPWCCILPAALAAAGAASSVVARWLGATMPLLLALSLVLFGRAHYLLWIRRHSSPSARLLTVILTLLSAAFWAIRLFPTVAAFVLGE